MIRNVILLATCQALMMAAMSGMIATTALVGAKLAANPAWATMPVAIQFLGMMLSTFPASMLMKRLGRKTGFFIGLSLGIVGGLLVARSIVISSFTLFCIGSFCIGVFSAVGQYYRFAAADVASANFKNNAISLVMAGGVIGGLLGPLLAYLSADIIIEARFAGSYVTVACIHLVGFVVVSLISFPVLSDEERGTGGRPLWQIATQPAFIVAVIGATVGYGVMNLVMTATPLAMQAQGLPFSDTKTVIQMHVVGMFLPSFFTGSLINRFGVERIMLTGTVLLMVCAGINLSGVTVTHFVFGLIILGVGWNFLFIGGTTLVTRCHSPAEKAKTQGLNDLIVFSTVAITALASGMLHYKFGWQVINYGVLPFIFIVFVMILLSMMRVAKRENGSLS